MEYYVTVRGLVSLSSKLLHSCFTITSCQLTRASHVQNSVHSSNLYKHVMCMCVFVSTKNLRCIKLDDGGFGAEVEALIVAVLAVE